jgi:hypothetical protein
LKAAGLDGTEVLAVEPGNPRARLAVEVLASATRPGNSARARAFLAQGRGFRRHVNGAGVPLAKRSRYPKAHAVAALVRNITMMRTPLGGTQELCFVGKRTSTSRTRLCLRDGQGRVFQVFSGVVTRLGWVLLRPIVPPLPHVAVHVEQAEIIADLDPPHEALLSFMAWLVAMGLVGLVSLLVLRGLAARRIAPRKGSVS